MAIKIYLISMPVSKSFPFSPTFKKLASTFHILPNSFPQIPHIFWFLFISIFGIIIVSKRTLPKSLQRMF